MSKPIDRDPVKAAGSASDPADDLLSGEEPTQLRRAAAAGGVSRVDTLPEDFAKLLGRKPIGVGHVVGDRYRLVERLGGGAMGDVFTAENMGIGLRVAIKLLKPELLADAIFRQRFQHEAQAIAAIEHPNVARFLDLVVGDPTFLVMEYVRGPTLANRLREEKKLDPERAVSIAIRLSWALHAAHAAGVIHRDLKPSNVILSPDIEHGEVPKLIDFGLAKLATTAEQASLTRTGQLIGTPQYMSPEQIAGKNVDARSDIYALGCLLFEMLSGRPPFLGDDDFQVLYKQVHEPAEKLSAVATDVPKALEGVVACALAKEPDQRYASMPDLARALATAVDLPTAGIRASRDAAAFDQASRRYQLKGSAYGGADRKPRSRNMVIAVAAALVVLAFGGGLVVSRMNKAKAGGPGTATLFLLSEPAGALVEVDGKPLGQTTPTSAPSLPPGSHSVRFQRAGLAPVAQNVTVKAGERSVVQVTMPPVTHRLEVRSVPDGAAVFLDGRLVLGETPTSVEVTDDDFHELRIEKNAYETLTKAITPDDKAPSITVTLVPEKQARGTLMVDANTAAEVWIDGVNTGYTTPTLGIEVPLGDHMVEVRDGSGNKGPSAKVHIAKGQTVRLLLGAQQKTAETPAKP